MNRTDVSVDVFLYFTCYPWTGDIDVCFLVETRKIQPVTMQSKMSSTNYISDTKFDQILNDKDKLHCDGQVTDTEYSEAIGNRKWNKSPRLGGLTVVF